MYGALVAGSEKGVTVRDNVDAFSELGFAPHVAGLSAQRDLSTTVMGQPVSLPVLISPTGVQAVHPDGEVAVARAAAARGTVVGLSSFGSKPVEEVVEASPQGSCRPSPRRSATRSRSSSTAGSAAAGTWSRRWRWAPGR